MNSRALAGGRAPRSWQRGIAHAVAPLAALRRSTAWLGALARVRLTLRDEPLLGRCFTELALRPFPSSELRGTAGKPAPIRSRFSQPPVRRTRPAAGERRSAPAEGVMNRAPATPPNSPPHRPFDAVVRAKEPLRLEARAGRELLEQLVASERTSPVRSETPLDRGVLLARPAGDPLATRRDRTSHRLWLQRLSRRIGRALGLTLAQAGGVELSVSSAPLTRREAGQVSREFLERPASPVPESRAEAAGPKPSDVGAEEPGALWVPWSLPLDGETAPQELLERWLVRPVVVEGRGDPPRAARPGATPELPSGGRSRSPQVPAPPSSSAPLLTSPASGPESEAGEIVEIPGPAGTRLPPPPFLPPFLRPRGAGDAAPRRPAPGVENVLPPPRGPAASPAEDLSALAANLQRILDEEARRHGIPV